MREDTYSNLKKEIMKIKSILCSTLLSLAALTASAQQGSWSGELNVMGTKLPLVFNLSGGGCTMDSPAQGAKGIPVEMKSEADGKTITITVPMIGAKFEGKIEGESINGTFTQNGFPLPLTLKAGKPEVKRPQTPVAPFPYKEESVSFTNDGYTFGGTLTLPENCTKQTPVVLMVTGSGQQDRNEELFDHKPFAVIADYLARNGVASLRYDDRGWGDKTVNFTNFTTDDFRKDAEAALQLLRKRFDKVGVLGHSEGGTIALLLAEEGKTDFIVSLAGMAVSGKETIVQQNLQAMSSLGLPKENMSQFLDVVNRLLDDIAQGKKIDEININDCPAELKPILKKSSEQANSPYIRRFITVDASKQLGKITCPVLALNGNKDMQVDCTTNTAALEKGLTGCKHTVKKFDSLNHLFQHCTTGSVMEYQQIEETIAPEVLETIAKWIKTEL